MDKISAASFFILRHPFVPFIGQLITAPPQYSQQPLASGMVVAPQKGHVTAILGAAALPDIGHFFPNTSKECEGMDSQDILRRAVAEIEKLGYKLVNIDSSLIAETPKLSPHLADIKRTLAKTLGIAPEDVGVKATTNEKMGWIGRKEGLAAHAVCLIEKA